MGVLYLRVPIAFISCSRDRMQKITLQTSDNVHIVGTFWSGRNGGVVLLHMMPATKESWTDFAKRLNDAGYSVLAIDLRGHGESSGGDYRQFSDAQHQGSIHDVEASVDYLKNHAVTSVSVVGASIGANLALQYQSTHLEIQKTILLSPGTNYRGILAIPFAEKLSSDQQLCIMAGTMDGRSAGRADLMAQEIGQHRGGKITLKILETTAHGTDMLTPELEEELVRWLE